MHLHDIIFHMKEKNQIYINFFGPVECANWLFVI
jgi:hypothetical protein